MKESTSRWSPVWACVVIVLATFAAYANSFSGPFILDDPDSILDNPTIRHLWPLGGPLSPPHGGLTVEGRPLLNLSLALNYAISGTRVWSYHALNVAIHALAGLVLFGVVRRTLWAAKPSAALPPTLFAFAAALLWVLHPLQTESVTYVVQRAESLMGLFYLLTLYGFIRGVQAPSGWWLALSVVTCALGMATKEVMVTAPVVVALYDYTFFAGRSSEAWRRRRGYYLALAGTWVLLLGVLIGAGNRGGTIGPAAGVMWWEYGLTQLRAIPHYLALSFWPQPLIFDYGSDFVRRVTDVAPQALLLVTLVAATAVGLWRRSAAGFLGACFFVMLSPSSSVVGGTRQMISEHRMYLPLAAVVVLALLGLFAALGRRGLPVALAVAAALGVATARRNADYRDELTLWGDTAAKRPGSEWAQNDFGSALLASGRVDEAIAHFTEAVRLRPAFAGTHYNLGNALLRQGRLTEAIDQYEETVRLRPDYARGHDNLAAALQQAGRAPEALEHFEAAVRLAPDQAEMRNNLGNAYRRAGRLTEALAQYAAALQLNPGYAQAHYNLGNALADLKRNDEAVAEYQRAVQIDPSLAAAHNNLGNLLLKLGQIALAVPEYAAALRVAPEDPVTHYNLANALLRLGRPAEAVAQYREALRLRPEFPEARAMLDRLQAQP